LRGFRGHRYLFSYLDPRFGGVFRDAPHFQQFLLQLHRMQHRKTAMFENTVALVDFVVSIVLVVTTAKWAARRTSRIKALLFTCAEEPSIR